MSAPQRDVPIRLDRTRHLRFTFSAYAFFERQAKISINALFALGAEAQKSAKTDLDKAMAFFNAVGDDKLPILLWAGCRHEDRDSTLDDIEAAIDFAEGDSIDAKKAHVLGRIMEAICISKGTTVEKAAAEAKKNGNLIEDQTSSTGISSSELPMESSGSPQT
jgi:hypothetical protein